MKVGLAIAACILTISALGQGTVLFDNRVPGIVDARWSFSGGVPMGAGWTAQLFGGPETPDVRNLVPLLPTTTFKSSTAADMGYLNAVVVTVPGVAPGAKATLQMRAFFDSAPGCFATGNAFEVTLGGGQLPPAYLTGLKALDFLPDLACIPEPSTVLLGIAGAGVFLFVRWRKQLH